MRVLKAPGMDWSPFAFVAEDMCLAAERKGWGFGSDYYLAALDSHCWEEN